jgi:hypothetical protein
LGFFLKIDLGKNSPQNRITTVETTVSKRTDPDVAMLCQPTTDASRRSKSDIYNEYITRQMLLPTNIVVIYCPGDFSKIRARKSNIVLCLRSISSRSRFLLKKAISIPEKKADKISMIHINIAELIRSAEFIYFKHLYHYLHI